MPTDMLLSGLTWLLDCSRSIAANLPEPIGPWVTGWLDLVTPTPPAGGDERTRPAREPRGTSAEPTARPSRPRPQPTWNAAPLVPQQAARDAPAEQTVSVQPWPASAPAEPVPEYAQPELRADLDVAGAAFATAELPEADVAAAALAPHDQAPVPSTDDEAQFESGGEQPPWTELPPQPSGAEMPAADVVPAPVAAPEDSMSGNTEAVRAAAARAAAASRSLTGSRPKKPRTPKDEPPAA